MNGEVFTFILVAEREARCTSTGGYERQHGERTRLRLCLPLHDPPPTLGTSSDPAPAVVSTLPLARTLEVRRHGYE